MNTENTKYKIQVKYRTYGEHRKYRIQVKYRTYGEDRKYRIQNTVCTHIGVHCARGFAMNWISMIRSNFTKAQAMPNTLNCGRKWKQCFFPLAKLCRHVNLRWYDDVVDATYTLIWQYDDNSMLLVAGFGAGTSPTPTTPWGGGGGADAEAAWAGCWCCCSQVTFWWGGGCWWGGWWWGGRADTRAAWASCWCCCVEVSCWCGRWCCWGH